MGACGDECADTHRRRRDSRPALVDSDSEDERPTQIADSQLSPFQLKMREARRERERQAEILDAEIARRNAELT